MLTKSKYEIGQLSDWLKGLQSERARGTLYIDTIGNSPQNPRSHVLVLQNGEIVYGGLKIPNHNHEFAKMIGMKCSNSFAEPAIKYMMQRLQNPSSFRELLEGIVRIRVFKWQEIEAAMHDQVVQVLEQILPQPGELVFDSTMPFDLSYGEDGHSLDWSKLMHDVTMRQQEWAALAPFIPSMDAVPKLSSSGVQSITDAKVQDHLQQWVDGVRSLIDIAQELDQDPLQLARSYLKWAVLGWVNLGRDLPIDQALEEKQRPIVLSVDDSLIVQTMIKRTLVDHYQVFLVSNAVDALKVINTNPISLLLLDVTMPEIDGLEFCKTVRSIPKFKDLPIVMLTARDKFSDKLRGQIAGATHYLNKPVEPNQLLEVVGKSVENAKLSCYA
jgi:CheY-like chemotaxis protein